MIYDPRWADALGQIESSNNYGALGPVTKSGDRAFGRFQVMGANVPEWTKAALGYAMSPQEFLQNPQAQDAVFKHQFGSYVDKYGNPQDAASTWFTGRPMSRGGNASDGYITGNEYVRRFNKALGNPQVASNDPNSVPALSPAAQLGRGALGMQADQNSQLPWYSRLTSDGVGDGLIGAGAALASISSPQQGAALASLAKTAANTGSFSAHVDPKTGRGVRVNSKTGEVIPFQAFTPVEDPKDMQVDPSVLKSLSEDWTSKYGALQYAAERAKYFQDAIDKGQLDPSLVSKGRAAWESVLGKSSPQTQLYNDFQSWRTQLANDSLRLNKGVQTEGDAARARDELVTSLGAYDPATTSAALGNFIDRTGKVMSDSAAAQLNSYSSAYKNQAPFKPYYDQLAKQQEFYRNYAESRKSRNSGGGSSTEDRAKALRHKYGLE